MANANVEKLKALGLRHGEKAVVGLAAALCLLFLFKAVTRETIDITPDQVQEHAKQAKTNIERHQEPESIVKRLEDAFLKKPEFEQQVDKLASVTLDASIYKPKQPWVTTEPGAGLLRDTPELIAVSELYAYPGRGGALVFALDENGDKIVEKKSDLDDTTKNRRKRKRRRSPGGMGMMGGMMGGGQRRRNAPRKSAAEREREAQREFEEKKEKMQRGLAGKDAEVIVKKAEEEAAQENFKETTKGLRWVVLTGTLDYKKLRDNYYTALKRREVAYPHFRAEGGLDVQRQVLQDDGTWGEWEDVDREANNQILDNLPENEEEIAPDDVLLDALVDPLPFLKAGLWERVHMASLVPKEKKEITKPATAQGGGMPGMMGNMMRGGGSGMMGDSTMMKGMMGMMGGSSPRMGGSEMMKGMMGMGSMGGGGAPEDTSFDKTEADVVMIRVLDFTPETDTTYRYRVRLVVYNPNKGHEDVNPGVDTKTDHLKGPWSEPTEPVTMPADITPYTMQMARAGKRPEELSFQVARFTPDDGVTVVRTFTAAPGDIIGDEASTLIPSPDGKKPASKKVDYNSHTVLLDALGGQKPLPPVGAKGGDFDIPAVSLLVRNDGAVVVRTQAADVHDDVRQDIDSNYKKELKDSESKKSRESSYGAMGGGMMGNMMMGGNAAMPGMGVGGSGGFGGMYR